MPCPAAEKEGALLSLFQMNDRIHKIALFPPTGLLSYVSIIPHGPTNPNEEVPDLSQKFAEELIS